MSDRASMNRSFRLVWSDRLNSFVVAAETARGRGKRAVRLMASVLLAVAGAAGSAHAQSVVPLAPAQLPTGGKVVAGQASIVQGAARLDINQTSNRAAIDWQTFNVGSNAQVNFNQPNAQSVTLNRVLDSQPSQIYGRISANGQVFLTNPNGVYFSPSASVDVGGFAVTTHGISNTDFMAGKFTFERNGATGAVVNQGALKTALGGYIALLAPEVRNEGVIVAQAGTVALAAGESITLNFDGTNSLAGVTVTQSQIKVLVENKQAVLAPGGLIILSAHAADRLQGGVVKNSGTLEASGIARIAGRIVLDASDRVENSGTVRADAGTDGSPAGSINLSAPAIINAGWINAAQPLAAASVVSSEAGLPLAGAGRVVLRASDTLVQTTTGGIDVSGAAGGSVVLKADHEIGLQGSVNAASTAGMGGSIDISAPASVTVQAVLDVTGADGGGRIQIQAIPATPLVPATPASTVMLNGSQLRAGSSRGRGGVVTVEGAYIRLAEGVVVDASGSVGGGVVLVGGDWQGTGPLYQATKVVMDKSAIIDVSATRNGDGGKAVLWSDITKASSETVFNGRIAATGAGEGKGGKVETSGHRLAVSGSVKTGKTGLWLLDPHDVTIDNVASSNVDGAFGATGAPAVVDANAIAAALTSGGDVTVTTGSTGTEEGYITINSNIQTGAMANDATLTLKAERGIVMNAGTRIDATQNGNSNKLNVVLWANATGSGRGGIEMGSNAAIRSNGGNIVLGGGSDIATGYATGASTAEGGRGIWLRDGTVLDAAGGNIILRGQGRDGGEGIVLGDPGADPINPGSGLLVTTGVGSITLNGRGTTAIAGSASTGIKLYNDVRIQSDRGAIALTGVGGDTSGADPDNSGILAGPGTRILSASGPIVLDGNVGTGGSIVGSGLRFTTGTNYLGHDDGTNLGASSSNITFSADAVRSDSATTLINTTGVLTFQPGGASFSDTFNWSGNLSGNNFVGGNSVAGLVINNLQNIGGLMLGKNGNLAGITISSPLTLNALLNLTGGDIQINGPLTLVNHALTITNSGLFATGDGQAITAQGGFTQNGSGASSLGGDISTGGAPLRFAGDLTIRDQVTLSSSGGDITLGGAASGGLSLGGSQLALNSGSGKIVLNGEISNLGRLTLTSSGMTTQAARMRVNNLLLDGFGGDYLLMHGDNQIGTVAASVDTGSVVLKNSTPLTIGTVGGVQGVVSTNGSVQIETAAGQSLTVNQPVSGPSPTLISGGDLTLGAAVTATLGDLLLSAGGVFVNTVGPNVLQTPGRWFIYSNTPSANTFGGLASGNTGVFGKRLADYSPGDAAADGITGNRYVFAHTQSIAVTTVSASNIYGAAPLSLANYYSILPDTFGGAIVAPTVTGVPVIDSAGSSATAHAGSYAITADVSGMCVDTAGYNIIAANLGTLTISPRPVTLAGGRVYDATTAIAASLLAVGNIVNADTVTLSGNGVLSSKNVGNQTLSGAGSLTLSNSDYTVSGATAAITITPVTLPPLPVTDTRPDYAEQRARSGGGTLDVSGAMGTFERGSMATLTIGPDTPTAGQVPVVVAEASDDLPSEYSFPLPQRLREMLDAAGSLRVAATQADRKPLPNWLRFDRWNKKFVASAVPPNALPMNVMITLGARTAMLKIALPASLRAIVANATGK